MTTAELALGGLAALMGSGNVYNWLSSRGKTRVDLIGLAQSIAAETIKALKDREDALMERIDGLESRIGELSQHIESLEAVIRGAGLTPPPRPGRKS